MSLDYLKLSGHSPGFHLSVGYCRQAAFFPLAIILHRDYQSSHSTAIFPKQWDAMENAVFLNGLPDPMCFTTYFFFNFKKKLFFMFITTSVICISKLISSWAYSWFFGKYLCFVNVPTTHKATGTRVNRPQQCLDPCLNTWLYPRNCILHWKQHSNRRTRLEVRPSGIGAQIWCWLAVWPCNTRSLLIFSIWKPGQLN